MRERKKIKVPSGYKINVYEMERDHYVHGRCQVYLVGKIRPREVSHKPHPKMSSFIKFLAYKNGGKNVRAFFFLLVNKIRHFRAYVTSRAGSEVNIF